MTNFIVVDFGASLMHTHHSRVIEGFSQLLLEKEKNFEILLPLASEINISCSNLVRKNLLPSYHPAGFSFSRIETYVPALLGKLFSLVTDTSLHKFVSRILISLTVRKFYKYLRSSKFREELITIIFPTACPITFEVGKYLNKKNFKATLIYRLTNTAERRGFHLVNFDLRRDIQELQNSNCITAKFAYEMVEYVEDLPVDSNLLSYSPTPPCKERLTQQSDSDVLIIAFLGMAQKHKGIKWLAELVEQSFKMRKISKLRWIIQTETTVPPELIFLSNKYDLLLLPGRLNENEMSDALAKAHLICLPYNKDSYLKNASALAYRAADNFTAVATFRGTAFANEIEKYGIGIVADTTFDLVARMTAQFEARAWSEKIIAYNLIRKNANLKLLDL